MFHSFRSTVDQARRHGKLHFASLLPEEYILGALGPARALWKGSPRYLGSTRTSALDDAAAVRADAKGAYATRSPHPRRAVGLPYEDTGCRDHSDRCPEVSSQRHRITLSAALASRTSSAKFENDFADGPPAMQNTGAYTERILHARLGLQSDPPVDDDWGDGIRYGALGDKFQRHLATAEPFPSEVAVRSLDRPVVSFAARRDRNSHGRQPPGPF